MPQDGEPERVSEPVAAASVAVAEVALKAREAAFIRARRAPQPALRWRFLRFALAPRVVLRDVLVNDQRRFVFLLSAVAASSIVATSSGDNTTLSDLFSLCFAFVAALFFGVACVYARSPIISNVSRWLGGDITTAETRTLLAWAWLPMAFVGLLLFPRTLAVIAVHMNAVPGVFPTLGDRAGEVLFFYDGMRDGLAIVALLALAWAFVLEIVLIADAADISKTRAFIAACASSVLPLTVLVALLALSDAL